MHLIANGLPWNDGDEVLVIEGDYPATTLPWYRLAADGVRVRTITQGRLGLTAAELTEAITPRTRVLAVTWVDSFTGLALDLDQLGEVCQDFGVRLIVNASQAIGARPIDVSSTPVDAIVSCGYKWLCGPYGTGFTWLHPALVKQLRPQQAYWLAMQHGRPLSQMRHITLNNDVGVRALDVFCPASFATTLPWIAALELLQATGIDQISAWNQHLIDRLIGALNPNQYQLISPAAGTARSTLAVMARHDGTTAQRHRQLTAANIDTAYREGNIRLSPHLFNTPEDIDRALEALHS
jgi:selenocysteine lyase/cysteine desulfurase